MKSQVQEVGGNMKTGAGAEIEDERGNNLDNETLDVFDELTRGLHGVPEGVD